MYCNIPVGCVKLETAGSVSTLSSENNSE
jgi:hypothetical protein